jgi:hypothetical protein
MILDFGRANLGWWERYLQQNAAVYIAVQYGDCCGLKRSKVASGRPRKGRLPFPRQPDK